MAEFILVLTATSSKEEAQTIADVAVDQRVAAAVQIVGPITSTYRWNDQKEQAEEWLCILKTHKDLYSEIERLIQTCHSYELPGIVALPVITGSEKYFEWFDSVIRREMKEEILIALDEAHEKLIAAATAVSQQSSRREGEWGPREVLAHILGWEAEATVRIPLLAAGTSPLGYDDTAFNTAVITAIGNQSFEQVCETFRETHKRLITMLKEQDKQIFVPGHSVYRRVKAMIQHNLEHAQTLEALLP
jgi:periplasmic divalent cation tolerance protein